MLNNVTLIGRLGKDPEVRFTKSGIAVCDFSLATDIKLKGEKVVSWHEITIWGDRGEKAGQWLSKGRLAAITGQLNDNEWASKCRSCQGEIKRKDAVVTAQFWRGLDKPADSGADPRLPEGSTAPGGDDDIPFIIDGDMDLNRRFRA